MIFKYSFCYMVLWKYTGMSTWSHFSVQFSEIIQFKLLTYFNFMLKFIYFPLCLAVICRKQEHHMRYQRSSVRGHHSIILLIKKGHYSWSKVFRVMSLVLQLHPWSWWASIQVWCWYLRYFLSHELHVH